ncbi:ATP-dependent 6-phosphofructokinase [Kineococcus radiotolerans]|uniref:ATP-dependent 6-phosphofructokinase n=1 Tax=Kineococcus radiotolerans (strain ATCC BAA-149 / DSM 14245 / SRS30216) TaxID=266940 RepID=A6WFZ8_KINRD|nr:ATP-dependent 6-phosphofructokinase [Kineococcus radiotolerans]ABS05737.1 6-phosphofructokinase [Kineococcus radiotolerans SRS30216 = ATCC BAA-149]
MVEPTERPASREPIDFTVESLGPRTVDSPLAPRLLARRTTHHYIEETDRVLFDDTLSKVSRRDGDLEDLPSLEPTGPRKKIFFDPSKTRVGIVTCGGLCPGINNVIRGLVSELTNHYGVRRIYGFKNGYQGFIPSYGHDVVDLTPESVSDIDGEGGTILGTSRGQQDAVEVVDCLERMGISILFVIGGDGTMRGAQKISAEIKARDLKIAVVGIPKTIDNDIPFIDQSFGFQSAFSEATRSIRSAKVEARTAPNGVSIVKLMGRHSGFIACYAALAQNDADFVLIPEVPFTLAGPGGFLEKLREKVASQGHALVVAAEGAGQELFDDDGLKDASGNKKLQDVGRLLRQAITDDFAAHDLELNMRYIDPSYVIRSVPANPYDSVYCIRLAHAAVHAAMAGRTNMVVGRWRRRFVHIPIALAVSARNQVDPHGDLWWSVLEATGQPWSFGDFAPEHVSAFGGQ